MYIVTHSTTKAKPALEVQTVKRARDDVTGLLDCKWTCRIFCVGHSLGGAMASLCVPFMKGLIPTANVTFFGIGVPVSFILCSDILPTDPYFHDI